MAVQYGHAAACEMVLRKGADTEYQTPKGGTTALGLAVQDVVNRDDERGKLKVLQVLITAEANVDAVGNDGWTPIMVAARIGYPTLCAAPAEADADVSAVNGDSWTALHSAAQHGQAAVCAVLIEAGANTEHRVSGPLFDTALTVALQNVVNKDDEAGKLATVKALLDASADPSFPNGRARRRCSGRAASSRRSTRTAASTSRASWRRWSRPSPPRPGRCSPRAARATIRR